METKQTTFHYDGTNAEELKKFVIENGGTIEEKENIYILKKKCADRRNYVIEICKNEVCDIDSENLKNTNRSIITEALKKIEDTVSKCEEENEKFSSIVLLSDGNRVLSFERGRTIDLLSMLDISGLSSIKKYVEINLLKNMLKSFSNSYK